VRTLVHATRRQHADVNAELNRRSGIKRVTEATLQDLERRLDLADRWLRRLAGTQRVSSERPNPLHPQSSTPDNSEIT
jgi:lysyl-tRNA synthetase class I